MPRITEVIDPVAEVIEQQEVEQEVEMQEEQKEAQEEQQGQPDSEEDGEVVVSFGDQEPVEPQDQGAPEWVKTLRKEHRELRRRNKELEQQIAAGQQKQADAPTLGPKPKLSDVDYDAEALETALDKWYEQKRAVDEYEAKQRREQEAANQEWQNRLNSYNQAKANLRAPDYDDAELAVQDRLSQTQQGIILQGAENPALLVLALGRNPEKLAELSAINDPVRYAFAVARMEAQLKVSSAKRTSPTTQPEKRVSSDAGSTNPSASTLEQLRAEAEKTGDYSKVIKWKNQNRGKY